MLTFSYGPMRVLGGPVYPSFTAKLVEEIYDHAFGLLGDHLTQPDNRYFASQAFYTRLTSDVRGCDVFVVDPLRLSGDDIWAMKVLADTAKRSSARRVTAVLPYLEGRQDRKARGREPITIELALRELREAGVDRFLSLDLHID
jgi:ribose-phosphate pyrophosphokinase